MARRKAEERAKREEEAQRQAEEKKRQEEEEKRLEEERAQREREEAERLQRQVHKQSHSFITPNTTLNMCFIKGIVYPKMKIIMIYSPSSHPRCI